MIPYSVFHNTRNCEEKCDRGSERKEKNILKIEYFKARAIKSYVKSSRKLFAPVSRYYLYIPQRRSIDVRALLTRFIPDPIISWKTAFGSSAAIPWRIDKYFVVRLVAHWGLGGESGTECMQFSNSSGMHSQAILRNPLIYQTFSFSILFRDLYRQYCMILFYWNCRFSR